MNGLILISNIIIAYTAFLCNVMNFLRKGNIIHFFQCNWKYNIINKYGGIYTSLFQLVQRSSAWSDAILLVVYLFTFKLIIFALT